MLEQDPSLVAGFGTGVRGVPDSLADRTAPLNGRDDALAEVLAWWDRAADGGGPIIGSVTGEAQIGKTRLALELAALLRTEFPDGVVRLFLAPLNRPDAFLPAAERYDLVQSLDRRAALEAIRLLGAPGTGPLEVNVAAKTIGDPEFIQAVEEALREADADPRELVVELKEQVAVADLKRARAFVERVRAMGCGFALDNFGSGFGSFFYLKHLPVDYVKIDGDLVRDELGTVIGGRGPLVLGLTFIAAVYLLPRGLAGLVPGALRLPARPAMGTGVAE